MDEAKFDIPFEFWIFESMQCRHRDWCNDIYHFNQYKSNGIEFHMSNSKSSTKLIEFISMCDLVQWSKIDFSSRLIRLFYAFNYVNYENYGICCWNDLHDSNDEDIINKIDSHVSIANVKHESFSTLFGVWHEFDFSPPKNV